MSTNDDSNETDRLKEELRVLKNNFERLESHFQDSLDEVDKVRSEYEAKLIEANDKFRDAKAENEELKEKVDILFKLGRSYINRNKNDQQEERSKLPRKDEVDEAETIETIETITVEDVTEEDLKTWTKSKLRGFKRAGPATRLFFS